MTSDPRASFGKENLERLLSLATALPWSDSERLYEGLARFLVEHIMMTTIAAVVSPDGSNDSTGLKRRAAAVIEEAERKSSVSLKYGRDMVGLYVDALCSPQGPVEVKSEGESCSWILGCPAVSRPTVVSPKALVAFSRLENDHVFPKARLPVTTSGVKGQKLCAYHNRQWKQAHVCFALSEDWILGAI